MARHYAELRREEWKEPMAGNMQEIMTVWSVIKMKNGYE
jgi:hypothetical protein